LRTIEDLFKNHIIKKNFNKIIGKNIEFVQDNFSISKKGVFRGIHFQKKPYEQGKLVRVSLGRVIDIAVDLRKNSPTYLKWEKVELSDENRFQLWIPEGFGHAFFTLSDVAHFCYKTTNFYNKESEECIIWNDPTIGISFNENDIQMIISSKDLKGRLL
jgi:dTDP-4-dehydrorhamnose 3,5-epimerase